MFGVEEEHWWYVGLRELVFSYLSQYAGEGSRLLDAGCGTGGFLAFLEKRGGIRTCGFDFSEDALHFCRKRGLQNVAKGSVCEIPFDDGSFEMAVSLDVLCHMDVRNDIDAFRELRRVLVKGGLLILNLPAYDALRSTHDRAVHTRHRFTLGEVREKTIEAGFEIVKITYRNTLLFPLALLLRLIMKVRAEKEGNARSDLTPPPGIINRLLTGVISFENRLIRLVNLPFGLSVFCVARKQ
jgi:SAM-dependent methyltransferase